ncbi:hypothetical protein VTJ04DRAFT_10734 [Mycothermus thermophilus]|uniref:uncharacterized protein n=1 Tax=Humicola insolens TaxID=85995 RepID=UPI0037431275
MSYVLPSKILTQTTFDDDDDIPKPKNLAHAGPGRAGPGRGLSTHPLKPTQQQARPKTNIYLPTTRRATSPDEHPKVQPGHLGS